MRVWTRVGGVIGVLVSGAGVEVVGNYGAEGGDGIMMGEVRVVRRGDC